MKIEKDLSPNFHTPTQAQAYYGKPRTYKNIVLHWWNDPLKKPTLTGTVNWLKRAGGSSAHYVVSDTRIIQLVEETNVAWHAGNINPESIGIEIDPQFPGKTYETVAWLVSDIAKRRGLKVNKDTVRGHKDFMSTQCPGTLDINRVITLANKNVSPVIPAYTLDTDIPTEVEDQFKLKNVKRYNKHWTFEQLIEDWVKLAELEVENIELKSRIKTHETNLENALTANMNLLQFQKKYVALEPKYEQLLKDNKNNMALIANLTRDLEIANNTINSNAKNDEAVTESLKQYSTQIESLKALLKPKSDQTLEDRVQELIDETQIEKNKLSDFTMWEKLSSVLHDIIRLS